MTAITASTNHANDGLDTGETTLDAESQNNNVSHLGKHKQDHGCIYKQPMPNRVIHPDVSFHRRTI